MLDKNNPNYKHGCTGTRLYRIWQNMKNRCYNPHVPSYKNYGGRGIKVCLEWREEFENFADWAIKNGYEDNLTIDRIDNNKGYNPANCRWATGREQSLNKRNTIKYRDIPIVLMSKNRTEYGFIRDRIRAKIPLDRPKRILVTNYTVKGKTQSLRAWARELGINSGLLHYWLNKQGISYIEDKLNNKG